MAIATPPFRSSNLNLAFFNSPAAGDGKDVETGGRV
jgi:hypothetical protein